VVAHAAMAGNDDGAAEMRSRLLSALRDQGAGGSNSRSNSRGEAGAGNERRRAREPQRSPVPARRSVSRQSRSRSPPRSDRPPAPSHLRSRSRSRSPRRAPKSKHKKEKRGKKEKKSKRDRRDRDENGKEEGKAAGSSIFDRLRAMTEPDDGTGEGHARDGQVGGQGSAVPLPVTATTVAGGTAAAKTSSAGGGGKMKLTLQLPASVAKAAGVHVPAAPQAASAPTEDSNPYKCKRCGRLGHLRFKCKEMYALGGRRLMQGTFY